MAATLAPAATITSITVVAAAVVQVGAQVRECGRVSRWCRPEPPNLNHGDDQEVLMPLPRCPRCGSAPITIMFGFYPLVFCFGCGARWTQTGNQQQAIKQAQEPALSASARYPLA